MSIKVLKNNFFITSDIHLGHKQIINHMERPFASVEEMDETLITNWNSVIPPTGIVAVLGDVSFHKIAKTIELVKRLNGHKYLVPGNHDEHFLKKVKFKELFVQIRDIMEFRVEDDIVPDIGPQRVVCCHYAMMIWNRAHYGAMQAFGHSHGNLRGTNGPQCDVGVDTNNLRPYSYEVFKSKIGQRSFKPVDHHTRRSKEPHG